MSIKDSQSKRVPDRQVCIMAVFLGGERGSWAGVVRFPNPLTPVIQIHVIWRTRLAGGAPFSIGSVVCQTQTLSVRCTFAKGRNQAIIISSLRVTTIAQDGWPYSIHESFYKSTAHSNSQFLNSKSKSWLFSPSICITSTSQAIYDTV